MALQEVWTQSETEYIHAEQGYLTYAAGLSQLVDLEIDVDRFESEGILRYARGLMFDGLREVVRYCNSTEDRTSEKTLTKTFDLAAPVMRALITRVYEDNEDQLDQLHPSLYAYRPLPVLAKRVYKNVARGRQEKVSTLTLIKPFRPTGQMAALIISPWVETNDQAW